MQTSLFERVRAALQHQWLLVVCIVALGSVAAVVALVRTHPKYVATMSVLMVAEPPEASNPRIPTTATKPLLSTDLPSLATDATVLDRFRADLAETASLETLRARIRAKVNPDSTVMPVQYTDRTVAAAIVGANTLGDEIVRFYRETATSRFDSLIADYQSQLAVRRVQLMRLDSELTAAARSYPYIDVSSPGALTNETSSVYNRLIALQTQRDEAEAAVAADAAAAQTTHRLITDAEPLAEREVVNSDSAYRNVRDQYAKDFAALKKLAAFGSDRYPGVVELRQIVNREAVTVAAVRRSAAQAGPSANAAYVAALDAQTRADVQYSSDAAKLRAQNQALTVLNAQLGRGHFATDVARIRREHYNAESAYATIADRLAKAIADRAEAASTGSVIVLDRAKYAPRVAFAGGAIIATAIVFLTVWLAVTFAMMVDGRQEWFRDARTVEAIYNTELIGSLS